MIYNIYASYYIFRNGQLLGTSRMSVTRPLFIYISILKILYISNVPIFPVH